MHNKIFTQQDKDFLIENGYLIFDMLILAPTELEDARTSLTELVSNNSFNRLVLQKDKLTTEELEYIETNFPNTKFVENSHDKWNGPQIELEGIRNYIFRNDDNPNIPQIWIQSPGILLFSDLRTSISTELYNYTKNSNQLQIGYITEFSNYGKIINHADAGETSQRLCVITFYLNDKSEAEGNGGELVLTTKNGDKITIPPYNGIGVILDFAGNDGIIRNNLEHEVTTVKNNFRRYTFLSGITL
jgi:hypothetical protein